MESLIQDSKQNLESVKSYRSVYEGLSSAQCEYEFGLLKRERIGETNISYYDVLTMKSINQLAMVARSEDNVQVLASRKKFPIYYKMLYYKFRKGQKRADLLNRSYRALNCLSRFSLPQLASLNLLHYLSNKELENLVKAVPETESR